MNKTGEGGIALLAIDLQQDFLAGNARMPVARNQVEGILSAANRLLVLAGEMGWTVAYIVNEFSPWDFPEKVSPLLNSPTHPPFIPPLFIRVAPGFARQIIPSLALVWIISPSEDRFGLY